MIFKKTAKSFRYYKPLIDSLEELSQNTQIPHFFIENELKTDKNQLKASVTDRQFGRIELKGPNCKFFN
jgi:hypothetical protein